MPHAGSQMACPGLGPTVVIGVFSEPSDFLSEINCPECGTPFKVAPVWEFVLRQRRSTYGNCWQIFALRSGAKLDRLTARSEDLEPIVDDFETANAREYLWESGVG